MILFLYGQDTYRSKKKLEEIKAKFLRDVDPSGLNMAILEGGKTDAAEMRGAISSAPFLAKKRLVILKNAIDAAKKADDAVLASALENVPEETILTVFEEAAGEDLDGKEAFARLRGGKFYPEFTPLTPANLAGWIAQETKARGAEFEKEALRLYSNACGNDLWKVSTELDQLAAYAKSQSGQITLEIVRSLANIRTEENLFDFLDAVGAKRLDRAAQLLERLLEQGESEVAILSRLQAHMRSLLVCADLSETGGVTKDKLSRTLGLHPFVAGKVLSQTRYFTRAELANLYDWLIEADRKLKTGGWPKPRMAIDVFLIKLAAATVTA